MSEKRLADVCIRCADTTCPLVLLLSVSWKSQRASSTNRVSFIRAQAQGRAGEIARSVKRLLGKLESFMILMVFFFLKLQS